MGKMNLSEEAKKKRYEYMKKWRDKPENKKKQREYMRKWRERNKDKVLKANERYWERQAEKEEQQA